MSLGLIDEKNRIISNGYEYDHLFPRANNKSITVLETNDIEEIIPEIQKIVSETLYQTKAISGILRSENILETCKNIWSWCRKHIRYATEEQEQLREPARSWADRFTGIDCDCFSILNSSILTNLGIEHYYRIARYNSDDWQHIYLAVPNKDELIILDCVKDKFNQEHATKYKTKDFMALELEVNRLSGISNNMQVSTNNAAIIRGGYGETTETKKSEETTEKESIFSNPIVWVILIAIGGFALYKMFGDKKEKKDKGLGETVPLSSREKKMQKELNEWEKKEERRKAKEKVDSMKAEYQKKIDAANNRARNAKKGLAHSI